MPIVICKVCPNKFYAKPSAIKKGFGKYCSAGCHHKDNLTGKYIKCFICGKDSYKQKRFLSRSKSGKFFCGKSCQTKWRNAEFIGAKHANYTNGQYSYKSVLTRHKVIKICTLCSTEDTRILAVHHVDEDHLNNNVRNLAWLCHNCHFLVHHDKLEKQKFLKAFPEVRFRK